MIDWATIIGLIAIPILAGAVGYGMQRGKILELAHRVDVAENKLDAISEVYVNYKHFNEIMANIRETNRELKEDLRKILDILGSRP